jgi:hypothetical protein
MLCIIYVVIKPFSKILTKTLKLHLSLNVVQQYNASVQFEVK